MQNKCRGSAILLPAGRCRCRIINGKETPFQKKSTSVNHTDDDDDDNDDDDDDDDNLNNGMARNINQ